MFISGLFELSGDPSEVLFQQAELRQRVVVVGVKAGRDEQQFGFKVVQGRKNPFLERDTESWSSGSGRQGYVADQIGARIGATSRIEWMLEGGTEEHGGIAAKDVLRTVTMMHVDVDDRDLLQPLIYPAHSGRADSSIGNFFRLTFRCLNIISIG